MNKFFLRGRPFIVRVKATARAARFIHKMEESQSVRFAMVLQLRSSLEFHLRQIFVKLLDDSVAFT
jgi:hypothetical protein